MARVLQTIPLKKVTKISDSYTWEASHIQYHDLNCRELRSMNFALIDNAGNEVNFTDKNQNIVMSLVLKTM